MSKNEYTLKYILLGDSKVGKTSLLSIFTNNKMPDRELPTIGVDFGIKQLDLNGKLVKNQVWDSAGRDQFRESAASYCKGVVGIILVYDITNLESFQNLQKWLDIVKNESSIVCKILVGNKNDLEKDRKVTFEQGKKFAKKNGMKFLETSAKENTNVNEIFLTMMKEIIKPKPKLNFLGLNYVIFAGICLILAITFVIYFNFHK